MSEPKMKPSEAADHCIKWIISDDRRENFKSKINHLVSPSWQRMKTAQRQETNLVTSMKPNLVFLSFDLNGNKLRAEPSFSRDTDSASVSRVFTSQSLTIMALINWAVWARYWKYGPAVAADPPFLC